MEGEPRQSKNNTIMPIQEGLEVKGWKHPVTDEIINVMYQKKNTQTAILPQPVEA